MRMRADTYFAGELPAEDLRGSETTLLQGTVIAGRLLSCHRRYKSTRCAALMVANDFNRSPFEFLSLAPQGHDKALKRAVYDAGTPHLPIFVSTAGVAVYFALQSRPGPMKWTPLLGSMLRPFERGLCGLLGGWLGTFRHLLLPLAVGVVCLGFQLAHMVAERARNVALLYLGWFLETCVLVPLLPCTRRLLLATVASGRGSKSKKKGTGGKPLEPVELPAKSEAQWVQHAAQLLLLPPSAPFPGSRS